MSRSTLLVEIDHDGTRLTLNISNLHPSAITRLKLVQERKRIMVIDKTHRLARGERVKRTKNGRVAKPLGNAARVKRVNSFGRCVIAGV